MRARTGLEKDPVVRRVDYKIANATGLFHGNSEHYQVIAAALPILPCGHSVSRKEPIFWVADASGSPPRVHVCSTNRRRFCGTHRVSSTRATQTSLVARSSRCPDRDCSRFFYTFAMWCAHPEQQRTGGAEPRRSCASAAPPCPFSGWCAEQSWASGGE
eukprot:SAG11_NODE_3401_length_2468_cov_1.688054_2_plen_159_part_00